MQIYKILELDLQVSVTRQQKCIYIPQPPTPWSPLTVKSTSKGDTPAWSLYTPLREANKMYRLSGVTMAEW